MRKAVCQTGHWTGFVVKEKGEKAAKEISAPFETLDGAQTFMDLAKKSQPTKEFFIFEKI